MTKLEEIARAIRAVPLKMPGMPGHYTLSEDFCLELARAAVQATREATEALTDTVWYRNGEWSRRSAEAFIDAILNEKTE